MWRHFFALTMFCRRRCYRLSRLISWLQPPSPHHPKLLLPAIFLIRISPLCWRWKAKWDSHLHKALRGGGWGGSVSFSCLLVPLWFRALSCPIWALTGSPTSKRLVLQLRINANGPISTINRRPQLSRLPAQLRIRCFIKKKNIPPENIQRDCGGKLKISPSVRVR